MITKEFLFWEYTCDLRNFSRLKEMILEKGINVFVVVVYGGKEMLI